MMQQDQLNTNVDSPRSRKKHFSELYGKKELAYYATAIVVYILLGLFFTDKVLNFVVGPLFFIGWMWVVPPLWERWRGK